MTRDETSCSQVLPFVLLTFVREEFSASPAELVYGDNFRLPDNLVHDKRDKRHWRDQVVTTTTRGRSQIKTTSGISSHAAGGPYPWGTDGLRKPLQPSYKGPYKALEREDHLFKSGHRSQVQEDLLGQAESFFPRSRRHCRETRAPRSFCHPPLDLPRVL